jgi:hypothetical protein
VSKKRKIIQSLLVTLVLFIFIMIVFLSFDNPIKTYIIGPPAISYSPAEDPL